MHFAQGSNAAAVTSYLSSLALASHFFSSARDLDEKLSLKLARSLSELQFHTYALALSQVGEPDYSVGFTQLEERQSNDAMDSLYPVLWDVTLLEYAVSMHTKRGEYARRRKALKQIGALEVNASNNVEILRAIQQEKSQSLLRTMCLHFFE